jgi:hypothetical protein
MGSPWKECVAALATRLREINSPLSVPAAVCVIYQRHVPGMVLQPPATTSIEDYISSVYSGAQVLQPLQLFLSGGLDFGSVETTMVFCADTGEYGCSRKPEDPLKALLESAIPPGDLRVQILQTVSNRLQACYQRQFLEDKSAAYMAQERRAQTNAASLLNGSSAPPVPFLLTAFIGILEATGAVNKGYLTSHQILQIAHVLAAACENSPTVQKCQAAIEGSLSKQHMQILRKMGFRV